MSSTEHDVRQRSLARCSTSRSPHPYHRKSISLRQRPHLSSSTDVAHSEVSPSSDSSEDQALEADDEKGPLLRLLAPPQRYHKGLKDGNDSSLELTPFISPAQTPSVEKAGFFLTDPSNVESTEAIRQEQFELHAKYLKRRRAEVVRRAAETSLLLAIGLLSSLDRTKSLALWSHSFDPGLTKWSATLGLFFAILLSCYLLYPLRRTLRLQARGIDLRSAVRIGFHIPSRFDPGILLYPVLLPVYIAATLSAHGPTLFVNFLLGLASMPQDVIPFSRYGSSNVHWLLTTLPIFFFFPVKNSLSTIGLDDTTFCMDMEEMVLIFPLHQNLVKAISNLVTGSLDPAETELLSAGLINLLLFAASPQAQILKALLWVGGLCLFIFCEFALKIEVSLARIPAWRFARNKMSRRGISGRLNRILRALLPEFRSRFALSTTSDSEDETSPKLRAPKRRRRVKPSATLHTDSPDTLQKTFSAGEEPTNGHAIIPATLPKLARSATFSTFGRAATAAVKLRDIANSSNPYTRLNFLHAQAFKLILAGYTYVTVALVILLPVRYFISQRALSGNESIGWAIGYFFGDFPTLRMLVVNNNLDRWITLPLNKSRILLESNVGWVERYQKQIIGSANFRLLLAGYCVLMVTIGIVTVLQLNKVAEVDTRRKVFHGVMVAMLLPTIPIDPCFFALALMIVLAVFLMLDLFRASQLPPISRPLTNFLAPYIDGRDYRGPVVVSHIFLLIGCAIPLWLSLASVGRTGSGPWTGWEVTSRDLCMISGVVCVGMGDAAASLIGRRYGKTKWYWGGGKSIEGSVAFAFAVMAGLMISWLWLRLGGWIEFDLEELPMAMTKALVAGAGASLMESCLTAANDNVVVPIGLWLLVRGLHI